MFRKGKHEITVEIVQENGDITRKKCPIDKNTVVIKRKKGRGLGWAPEFTRSSILKERVGLFKRLHEKLMVRHDAEECVDFAGKDVDVPKWNKPAAEKFLQAGAATRLGDVRIKHELPTVFWLLFVGVCGQLLFSLLMMYRLGMLG